MAKSKSKTSIYFHSAIRAIEYRVRMKMEKVQNHHVYSVEIGVVGNDKYSHTKENEVYKVSFVIRQENYWRICRSTLVSLAELLFPESKEKERELKEVLFGSLNAHSCFPKHPLNTSTGAILWDKNKPLPTPEEIKDKLSATYRDFSPHFPVDGDVPCLWTFEYKRHVEDSLLPRITVNVELLDDSLKAESRHLRVCTLSIGCAQDPSLSLKDIAQLLAESLVKYVSKKNAFTPHRLCSTTFTFEEDHGKVDTGVIWCDPDMLIESGGLKAITDGLDYNLQEILETIPIFPKD